ncbi:hypothetical protein CVT24_003132, partial [Panaeolus cyanescens]
MNCDLNLPSVLDSSDIRLRVEGSLESLADAHFRRLATINSTVEEMHIEWEATVLKLTSQVNGLEAQIATEEQDYQMLKKEVVMLIERVSLTLKRSHSLNQVKKGQAAELTNERKLLTEEIQTLTRQNQWLRLQLETSRSNEAKSQTELEEERKFREIAARKLQEACNQMEHISERLSRSVTYCQQHHREYSEEVPLSEEDE